MPPRDDRPRRRDDARGAPPARAASRAPARPAEGAPKPPAKSGSRAPRPLSERKPGERGRKTRGEAPVAAGPMRLQRALARAGVASRRAADALVAEGRVTVNGAPGEVGQVVDPGRDAILVDGAPIAAVAPREWMVLHKPAGVLTTRADPEGRPTVFDLVPDRPGLTYVGRLDYMTEGVLLLTTDGDAAHRLTHPSRAVERTYVAVVRGNAPAAVRALRHGLVLDDGPVAATEVDARPIGNRRWEFELTIAEGRTREVRRVCEALDLAVERLVRVRFGPVRLGALPSGEVRALNAAERRVIDALTQANLAATGEAEAVLRAVGRDTRRGEAQAPARRPGVAPSGRATGGRARDEHPDRGRDAGARPTRGASVRAGSDDRAAPPGRGARDGGPRDRAPREGGPGAARDVGTRGVGTRDYGTRDYGTRDYGTRDYGTRDYGTRDRAAAPHGAGTGAGRRSSGRERGGGDRAFTDYEAGDRGRAARGAGARGFDARPGSESRPTGRGFAGRSDRPSADDRPTRGAPARGAPTRGRPADDRAPRGRPGPGREPRPAGRVPGGGRGR